MMWRLFRTSVTVQTRERLGLIGVFFFSLLTIVLFNLVLSASVGREELSMAAIVWISTLLGGTLQINRTFDSERTNAVLDGFRLVPGAVTRLYLIKFFFNVVITTLVMVFSTAAAIIFFNASSDIVSPTFFVPMVLGVVGYCAVGTTFSGMVVAHHKKDMLLPAISYPIVLPIVLAVIQCYPTGGDIRDLLSGVWLPLVIVFDLVYVAAGFMVFETLVEE